MANKIVVTKYQEKILVLFLKNDKCVKIRAIDSVNDFSETVYLGRVETVKKNIDSCFVKYNGSTGFLKSSNYKPETVLPVMLKKETDIGKQDEITDKISVLGIYCIVSDSFKGVNFSSRIKDNKIDFSSYEDLDNVIIRQNSINTDVDSVINEYKYLRNILNHIKEIKDLRTDNSILFDGIWTLVETIFSEDISIYDEIITDIDEAYDLVDNFIKNYKSKGINLSININKYDDKTVPLTAVFSISSKLDYALNRKVFLKSDAYITIDKTEALTVVDVNSGTTVTKGDKAEVIHQINIEAAKEVALQLKLRNISGIIIVDFINEYKSEYKNELLSVLRESLKEDDSACKCYGMTKLGLIEISRKRKYKSLKEQLWK